MPHDAILDGELYEGRGLFQQTVGKVRKKYGPDWAGIRYMVFDRITGGTFEQRQEKINALDLPEHVQMVEQVRCKSDAHLERFMYYIIEAGGEGVMLRKPGSAYENGRSSALLKFKFFQSAEAIVIGYEEGKGRFAGLVGSLRCKLRDKYFDVGIGLSEKLRLEPPEINSRITFSFYGLTDGGLPRFPVFVAHRNYE